jgi:hypothetical protein
MDNRMKRLLCTATCLPPGILLGSVAFLLSTLSLTGKKLTRLSWALHKLCCSAQPREPTIGRPVGVSSACAQECHRVGRRVGAQPTGSRFLGNDGAPAVGHIRNFARSNHIEQLSQKPEAFRVCRVALVEREPSVHPRRVRLSRHTSASVNGRNRHRPASSRKVSET